MSALVRTKVGALYVPIPPKNHDYLVGRRQRQVRRAFAALNVPILTTSQLMSWAYPGQSRFHNWQNKQVRLAAARWCIRVGRSSKGSGRPVLWRLKDRVEKPHAKLESKT